MRKGKKPTTQKEETGSQKKMHPQRLPEEKPEGSLGRGREEAQGETKEPEGATEKKTHEKGRDRETEQDRDEGPQSYSQPNPAK